MLFHTPPATPVPRRRKRKDDDRIEAAWLEHKRVDLPKREDIAAGLEFHQVVAAMGSYPTLLRRLGLVVDLILAPGPFTQAAAADLVVRVAFGPGVLQVPPTTDARPVTRTRLTATHFDAVPDAAAEMKLKDGLLDLAPARYRLLQLDVDGAGLKVINFAPIAPSPLRLRSAGRSGDTARRRTRGACDQDRWTDARPARPRRHALRALR